jgi:hypothetical protein
LAVKARSSRASRRRRRAAASRWKRPTPGALLALAGTIIGLVSGIVGLVFLFKPDLQPSGEAAKQAATFSRLSMKPNASFREYLARLDLPATPYTEGQLARRGALLQFRVGITGFEGDRLILKWELFEAASGEQINESKATTISPTTETNEANWHFWVPLPKRAGKFYAVVELKQQKKHHLLALDTLQTDPFRGLSRVSSPPERAPSP